MSASRSAAGRPRSQLKQEAFATAWAEGLAMRLEQAIAEALGESKPSAQSPSQLG